MVSDNVALALGVPGFAALIACRFTIDLFNHFWESLPVTAAIISVGTAVAFVVATLESIRGSLRWVPTKSLRAAVVPKLLHAVGVDSRLSYGLALGYAGVLMFLAVCASVISSLLRTGYGAPSDIGRLCGCACVPILSLPGLSLAARRLHAYLNGRPVRVYSPLQLSKLLSVTALVVDKAALQLPDAIETLDAVVSAHVAVFVADCDTGIATEQTIEEAGFRAYNNTEAPLISKLSALIEARDRKTEMAENLHDVFGQMRKAVVSGVVSSDDIEQLVCLLTSAHDHSVAILCNDPRYHAATKHAAVALYPDAVPEPQHFPKRTVHLHSATIHSFLQDFRQVRCTFDNCWKVISYALSCSFPVLLSALLPLLGFPPPLTTAGVLAIMLLACVGGMALAVEPPEADLLSIPWAKLSLGLPLLGRVTRDFWIERWLSNCVQTGALAAAASAFAAVNALLDSGCESLRALLSGACDLDAAAHGTIVTTGGGTAEVHWEGTVGQAGRSAYLCAALVALSFGLLCHKTRRIPLFNAVVTPGHWHAQAPPASLLALPCLLCLGPFIVYHRACQRVAGTASIPPIYCLYALPFVAFLVVDSEFRKWSIVSQYQLFPKPAWLQRCDRWPSARRGAAAEVSDARKQS